MENGRFLGGERVGLRTQVIELAVDLLGGSATSAFEDHVFQKVTHTHDLCGLVARAGINEPSNGGRECSGVTHGNDLRTTQRLMRQQFHLESPGVVSQQ